MIQAEKEAEEIKYAKLKGSEIVENMIQVEILYRRMGQNAKFELIYSGKRDGWDRS